jgi:hypothetical protein
MNVAGVAAEAGGDATAVSECGIQFPVADVTGQHEVTKLLMILPACPEAKDL